MATYRTMRGVYDYNSIFINSDAEPEEVLSIIAHEVVHEYLTIFTNLGQLCWLFNNLAYNSRKYLDIYDYIFSRVNKNEEQLCLIFEISVQLARSKFKDNCKMLDSFDEAMHNTFKKNYTFYKEFLQSLNEENYIEVIVFLRTIVFSSMTTKLPDITLKHVEGKKQIIQYFEGNDINPKRKLKKIIKFCNDNMMNYGIIGLTKAIEEKFNTDNALPNRIFSVNLKSDTIKIDYQARNNPVTREFKLNRDEGKLREDIGWSIAIGRLLLALSEEQKLFESEDVWNRMLTFSDEIVSSFKEVKKKDELIDFYKESKQLSFVIPYNTAIMEIDNSSYAKYVNVLGIKFDLNGKRIKDMSKYLFQKLSLEEYQLISGNNNTEFMANHTNLLFRLTPFNNNFLYIKKLVNIMKSEESQWINIFIYNNEVQIESFLKSVKRHFSDITYRYTYEQVSVLEITSLKVMFFLNTKKIDVKKTDNPEPPKKEINVLVSIFEEIIQSRHVLFKYLDGKKLTLD
ncbi:hypothetical protein [Enterococcus sp. LJL51]|uniref:hypothetical protein n=1 Tax=Enterococcus sp. LJL51 TaxID=3416656 RepID=UPI003CEE05CD